jgi:prevent-host-death family protein
MPSMPAEPDEIVNIHEAKTNFSRLVERARRGERIVIGRGGQPVAQLAPLQTSPPPRRPGRDRIVIADDFDAPVPGFEA